MGYQEARELARIRLELRERLMTDRVDGADPVLARLREIATDYRSDCPDLPSEYVRWRMRFDVLAQIR